ncbi:unnamed protein product [Auanema sp. JU1783]|nr:unnamed protein product [Auanema sp. JU1783]
MQMDCDNDMSVQVPLNSGSVDVNLVQPRNFGERNIVSARETDRIRSDDLVALASQISFSRDLVKGRACDRLRSIAQQMEQLHVAAKQVLSEAARDEELHRVACNMQKVPGRVYHLYGRPMAEKYFSMLSPEEWGSDDKASEYLGSFRLEYDRSWTPLEDVEKRDAQFNQFENIIRRGGGNALLWDNQYQQ